MDDHATKPGKLRRIFISGWKGRCPRCDQGKMFQTYFKLVDKCQVCGLNYRFAAPDDGPAFFSLCVVSLPFIAFLFWFQIAINPPGWVYALVAIPLIIIGCLLPLRPIKGWLVASQYVNKAQEAGTEKIWAQLHGVDEEHER
jgi:uncharacterized protein (DUF983 family)